MLPTPPVLPNPLRCRAAPPTGLDMCGRRAHSRISSSSRSSSSSNGGGGGGSGPLLRNVMRRDGSIQKEVQNQGRTRGTETRCRYRCACV